MTELLGFRNSQLFHACVGYYLSQQVLHSAAFIHWPHHILRKFIIVSGKPKVGHIMFCRQCALIAFGCGDQDVPVTCDIENVGEVLVIRYEDLRKDPNDVMKQVMDFTGTPATEEEVQDAVDFAAYANMKKMEEKRVFRFSGGRMVAKDLNNPDSFKTRRAKVGGYRDYFDDDQVRIVDAMITDELNPLFGYKVDPEIVPDVEVGDVHDTGEAGAASSTAT